jgi:predicted DNA-binding transcriptional regulator YafY
MSSAKGGRSASLRRVLSLLVLLRSPRRLAGLADELRVTTRTIRRDFDVLRSAGFKVERKGERWVVGFPEQTA